MTIKCYEFKFFPMQMQTLEMKASSSENKKKKMAKEENTFP